ncbi:PCMD domain-containing protein [Flammeovirga sp. EKP202]|uniref:PCMD domain-containing protein n=1 Tax=Flammeovirga sp. EKP202 TaxID=2770592 RepID=UPI00165F0A7C|nr:PCMD domain-containing protein [Flammeovirga sp. EKP202]MBD0401665.1 PCMD domain-containing protein [Flammeovirga sp. EKP202]
MMKILRLLIISALAFSLSSCIDWDYFGLSPKAEITAFEVEGQSGTSQIDSANRVILVPVNEVINLDSLKTTNINISSLATVNPMVGEIANFSDTVIYVVTAEDGTKVNWKVKAFRQTAEVQIENSNFDSWYETEITWLFNKYTYSTPTPQSDELTSRIWDTANRGAVASFVDGGNTTPQDRDGGKYAQLESISVPIYNIAAGSLFAGYFTDDLPPDAANPRSNTKFGITFGGRPSSVNVDYRYNPGTDYYENRNPSTGNDQCDIYIILQKRVDGQRYRLGTAWHRSGDTVSDWTTLTLEMQYGELPAGSPAFMGLNQNPGEEEVGFADPNDVPTHILIVFSSSALGDTFTGAVGSKLDIDNLVLNY